MIRISRRSTLVGFAATGLVAATGAFAQQPTIRIGVILPLSGSNADNGVPIRIGMEITANQINAEGGVNGRKIELVIRDDKANPVETLSAYRELIGLGVKLFIGAIYTPLAMSILPLLKESNALLLSPSVTAMSFTHELFNTNFFRGGFNNYILYRAYTSFLAKKYPDVTTWSIFIPEGANGQDNYVQISDGLQAAYSAVGKEVRILPAVVTRVGQTNYMNEISQLMASEAQGMFSCLLGSDVVTLFTQAKSFGLDKKLKVICESTLEVSLAKTLNKNLPANTWSASYWYYGSADSNTASKSFYEAYAKVTGDKAPRGWVERGYTPLKMLATALTKAGSEDLTALIPALEGVEIESINGKAKFRPEDHQFLGNLSFVRFNPADNEQGWDVSETIPISMADVVEPAKPGVPFAK